MNPLFPPTNPTYHATQAQKEKAALWFEELRGKIVAALEAIERDYLEKPLACAPAPISSAPVFVYKDWQRQTPDGLPGGGGRMALLKGNVFEKAGVNVSTVYGHFSPEFRKQIPGAEGDGLFWASGVSLVLHPRNPHVPPVHMNTRHIVTSKSWFGGGSDLNPIVENEADTLAFHNALKAACNGHDVRYYPAYKKWADTYFFNTHRNEPRGVGGIFYDAHNSGNWDADFAFTQDVGRAFLDIYPALVRTHMFREWDADDRARQLVRRGRYAEFNLVYDRGTKFGLMTGGNVEAILMSLPPEASWP